MSQAKPRTAVHMAVAQVAFIFGAGCSNQPHPALISAEPAPIRVSQFSGAVGLLGKPLGERAIIEGTYSGLERLAENGLQATAVDGHVPATVVLISVEGVELKKGVRYRLEGYESGAFDGPPGWLGPGAQQVFAWHPCFIVTRSLSGPADHP